MHISNLQCLEIAIFTRLEDASVVLQVLPWMVVSVVHNVKADVIHVQLVQLVAAQYVKTVSIFPTVFHAPLVLHVHKHQIPELASLVLPPNYFKMVHALHAPLDMLIKALV
jgi:hypothetical protein